MAEAVWYIGLDLGQAQDYTALSMIEHMHPPAGGYHVRHLERFQLGTPYPEIVKRLQAYLQTPELKDRFTLLVDATGVGAPVVDMLRGVGLYPIGITITGGQTVNRLASDDVHVPKRDLVSTLRILLETKRLRIASELPEAKTLIRELQTMQVKINLKTAHDSYAAWREGAHDDLVLSLAIAAWGGENVRPARILFMV